jgi:hypothetical protein
MLRGHKGEDRRHTPGKPLVSVCRFGLVRGGSGGMTNPQERQPPIDSRSARSWHGYPPPG